MLYFRGAITGVGYRRDVRETTAVGKAASRLDSRGWLGFTGSCALVQRSSHPGEKMKFANMQHIPLSSAYLCPDCNCIGNCASQCPSCASPVLLALANVLNREPERVPVVAYMQNRHARRRAFLVSSKLRSVRPQSSGPTPITIEAGARARKIAPWQLAQREGAGEVIGFSEGTAS